MNCVKLPWSAVRPFTRILKINTTFLPAAWRPKKEEIDALTETHSPEEFLTVILEFIQQENRFFFNTFASDPERETLDILYTSFEKHFVSLLKEREADGLVLPGPPEVVISFFIGGLATSTLRWIKSNYKIPKEELAACQHRLLEGIL